MGVAKLSSEWELRELLRYVETTCGESTRSVGIRFVLQQMLAGRLGDDATRRCVYVNSAERADAVVAVIHFGVFAQPVDGDWAHAFVTPWRADDLAPLLERVAVVRDWRARPLALGHCDPQVKELVCRCANVRRTFGPINVFVKTDCDHETTPEHVLASAVLPDGLWLDLLRADDAETVAAQWYGDALASRVEYVRFLINSFATACARETADGSLAAWTLQYHDGALGMRYTTPGRRRLGLSLALHRLQEAQHARRSRLPLHLHIDPANAAARAMYERLGFASTDCQAYAIQ